MPTEKEILEEIAGIDKVIAQLEIAKDRLYELLSLMNPRVPLPPNKNSSTEN